MGYGWTTTEEPLEEEGYDWMPAGVGAGVGMLGITSGIIIAAAIRRSVLICWHLIQYTYMIMY